ncbi:MAG: fumarylacetoacetate hydrolase family protein [Polyangiales bacterium]
MAHSILRYRDENGTHWGLLREGRVHALAIPCTTTGELVGRGRDAIRALVREAEASPSRALDGVELLSPITEGARVLCQGANYRQHMIESGVDPDAKSFNMFFTKSSASLHAPVGAILRPPHVRLLDYEIELALVLGARTRSAVDVGPDDLATYVAGVCIANDVSARDVQIPQMQFHKGKSYRTFCPMGPVLALLEVDEMHQLDEMLLTLTVNGERRQHDHTGNLVFKPAETLSEYSHVSDFDPGDVILTGTPAGCALRIPSPVAVRVAALLPEKTKWKAFLAAQAKRKEYLSPGDVVESRITSRDGRIDLGRQVHVVRDAEKTP